MHELRIERSGDINPDGLHAELAAAVEGFHGISLRGDGQVYVALDAEPDEQAAGRIRAAVEGHDPQNLTPGQQKRAERKTRLDELRRKDWKDWTPKDKDDLLRLVAAVMLWGDEDA